jgi:RHS repeat-associated protein
VFAKNEISATLEPFLPRPLMVGMSGSPIGPATFTYDPFGRRASKTIAGATTQFQYDGRRVVQEIQPGAGNVLTNMGLSRTDSTGNMTFLGDILGSTLALANDAGAVATQYSYEPFGASTASGAASSNPYQFAFHQNDGTGLYYYSARYYSPSLARFISQDPSGVRGGINLYEYAGDQPVNFEDATGLSPSDGSGSCRPCEAWLRERHVNQWVGWLGIAHTFWETRDSRGSKVFSSGFPEGSPQELDMLHHVPGDDEATPIAFDSGLDIENCPKVDNLLGAADAWPNGTVPYVYTGPNSNTFAHYLAYKGGFPAYPTFGYFAVGWDYPLMELP